MSKDRRLGRGLAALLGTPVESETEPAPRAGSVGGEAPVESRTKPIARPRLAPETVAPEQHVVSSATKADSPEARVEAEPRRAGATSVDPATHPALTDSAAPTESIVQTELRSPATPISAPADQNPTGDESDDASKLLELNVYEIDDNPFQPRRDFSEPEIASLSESLKRHDMLQPVLVRRIENRYQLISGERRLRAAIQAGWATVPARVREADDRLVAELAIVENLQRQDLNAVEKALSFRRYLDQHECTQEEFANRLKIDRSTIANLLRLLELPEPVLEALQQGVVSAGHARALLPLGDEPEQVAYCERIVKEGWSVRVTEREVQEKILAEDGGSLGASGKGKKKKPAVNPQVVALEQELRMALGTKVEIRQTGRGRGRIVVHFTSHREFERVRDLLVGEDYADTQTQVG